MSAQQSHTTRSSTADARALVARLSREGAALREREVLAPALPGGRIRVRLSRLVYEFRLRGGDVASPFVGWGHFRPLSEREVAPAGEALPWERAAYLELFPALRVILLWPEEHPRRPGTWWALPYNESDARQRFGLDGADPLLVHLCDAQGGADRFERVVARVDGHTLWFDGADALADPRNAEWLRDAAAQPEVTERRHSGLCGAERLALLYAQVRALAATTHGGPPSAPAEAPAASSRERGEWLRRDSRAGQLEGNLRHALHKAGATLAGYSQTTNADGSPGPLVVEWSMNGGTRRYRSSVDPALTVLSSGICLSGRDRDFDLTSLVGVVADSPWE